MRKKYNSPSVFYSSIYNDERSESVLLSVTAILSSNDNSWITAQKPMNAEYAVFFWLNTEVIPHPLACCFSPEKPQLHFSSLAWSCDLEPKPVLMYTTVMEEQIIAEKPVLETIKAVKGKMQTCDSVCFCNHLLDLDRYIKNNGYSILERRIRVKGFGRK